MVFPNPVNDRVYINCNKTQYHDFQIYNIVGECVQQGILDKGNNEIDIFSLSKGIYIIKINGDNRTRLKKFIKE